MTNCASTARFMQKVPPTPLARHIESLHTMAYFSGIYGSALEMFEHHLMAVAVATAEPPEYRLPPRAEALTPEGYDACLLKPQYEEVGSFDRGELQRVVTKAAKDMAAGVRRLQTSLRERQTPEQAEARARRRYERQCDEQRAAAKQHLRNEVRRVRAELGLPEKTSPTKRGQS